MLLKQSLERSLHLVIVLEIAHNSVPPEGWKARRPKSTVNSLFAVHVVIVLEFAKEALGELNDTAVSIIEETLGAPREGNKT